MIIEMLRKHEGVETHAYKCTADKVTIGVGRNIDKVGGIGLSDDEIDYLLSNDIKRVIAELIRAFPWYSELDEVRKDALTD
jgi:lysozyme